MRIAARYLLREYALASGTVFLALGVTWVAADTMLRLDELDAAGLDALRWVAWRAAEFVPVGAPLACVGGVVWSVTRAVRAREVTAIRAGGIPLRGALAPILAASVLFAVLLAVFEDRVAIHARRAQAGAEAGEAGETSPPVMRNGRWWHAGGSTVFSAAHYSAGERALLDVTAFEYDERRRPVRRIDAARAVDAGGGSWEFHTARVREFDATGTAGLQSREVDALRVDLGATGRDFERAQRLEITTLHQLAERIEESRGPPEAIAALEGAFHGRLARPLGLVILVLLALPFAVGDVERGDSLPRALLAALAAAAVFYGCWAAAMLVAQRGWVPAALPVWSTVLLFLGLGYARFRAIQE